jgi:toxin ParE1/3/4
MPFSVFLTDDALRDLTEIRDYFAGRRDGPERAAAVLDAMEKRVQRLSTHPERGRIPRELRETGLREFREIFFKPYRILYRIVDARIYVLLVADGRRDMQSLLQRRLLRD